LQQKIPGALKCRAKIQMQPGDISRYYTPATYYFYTQGYNERPMVDKRL
jgi:hypothetical protein